MAYAEKVTFLSVNFLSIFLENLTTVLEQNIDFFSMFVAWNGKYASSPALAPIGDY